MYRVRSAFRDQGGLASRPILQACEDFRLARRLRPQGRVSSFPITAANVRLPLYRRDGLQRSITRIDPAGRGPPARVRKPVPSAVAAFAHQQRHVFADRRNIERTPVISVHTHNHEQICGLAPLSCAYGSGSLANSSAIRLASSTVRTSSGGCRGANIACRSMRRSRAEDARPGLHGTRRHRRVGEAPPEDHTENDNPVRIKIEAPEPMGLLP